MQRVEQDETAALQFLPAARRKATYRPAALRTNSSATFEPQRDTFDQQKRRARGGGRATTTEALHGPPTRAHWQPDSSSEHCNACPAQFSFLERRHHCRKCGRLFCGACSSFTVTLNGDARFSHDGQASSGQAGRHERACAGCRRDYELFLRPGDRPGSVGGGCSGEAHGLRRDHATRPAATSGVKMSNAGEARRGGQANDAHDEDDRGGLPAASVPRDWTWSTF